MKEYIWEMIRDTGMRGPDMKIFVATKKAGAHPEYFKQRYPEAVERAYRGYVRLASGSEIFFGRYPEDKYDYIFEEVPIGKNLKDYMRSGR